VEQRSPSLIQVVCTEIVSLLRSIFARRETMPYQELVSCPHCLANVKGLAPSRLRMEDCIKWSMTGQPFFNCGSFRVPVNLLALEVTFGALLDEATVILEPKVRDLPLLFPATNQQHMRCPPPACSRLQQARLASYHAPDLATRSWW
jgi:hypothetical protein